MLKTTTLVGLVSLTAGLLSTVHVSIAQGQYAGSMKPVVGSSFKNYSNKLAALEGFEFQEGSLLAGAGDAESVVVDVYQKGTTSVVFFSVLADTAAHDYQVMDAIELQVQPGWEVQTTFCKQLGVVNTDIVALVQTSPQNVKKSVKQAWRFTRSAKKFMPLNPRQVACL